MCNVFDFDLLAYSPSVVITVVFFCDVIKLLKAAIGRNSEASTSPYGSKRVPLTESLTLLNLEINGIILQQTIKFVAKCFDPHLCL